jgi:hypothetical protein
MMVPLVPADFREHTPVISGGKPSDNPGQEKEKEQKISLVGIDKRRLRLSAVLLCHPFHNGFIHPLPFFGSETHSDR